MKKVILHCDINNFYASVECVYNPKYNTVPIAITGNPEVRHGIILAKNEIAKKTGIKTGETINEARKKCPSLICLPPRFEDYVKFSNSVKKIYLDYTDRIESFGLDECWLDVSGSIKLFGSGKAIADAIRQRVKEEIGLTISVGVSFTKTFAKLGSDLKKPDATTVISESNFKEVVFPLPISEMLMIGKHTVKKLNAINIFTIKDLAAADKKTLKQILGINGEKIINEANGLSFDKVLRFDELPPVKSVGHGTTTARDLVNNDEVKTIIIHLSDMVCFRLRRYGMFANGVSISLRDNSLNTLSRSKLLLRPTNLTNDVATSAYNLFLNNYNFKYNLPLRTITISVYDLISENIAFQPSLFDDNKIEKLQSLELSMDKIRQKFGYDSIKRGALLENDFIADKHSGDDEFLPFKKR